jgi:cytochrome c biogenesis protein CcdA/tetratricopeptide (TPR) repeat protein
MEGARRVCEAEKDPFDRAEAWIILASQYHRMGNRRESEHFAARVLEAVEEDRLEHHPLGTLCRSFLREGLLESARKLALKIPIGRGRAEVLAATAGVAAERGDREGARGDLKMALASLESAGDRADVTAGLRAVVRVSSGLDDPQWVQPLLQEAVGRLEGGESANAADVLEMAAHVAFRAGNGALSYRAVKGIGNPTARTDAALGLAGEETASGDSSHRPRFLRLARRAARSEEDPVERASGLCRVVESASRLGQNEMAREVLEEAREAVARANSGRAQMNLVDALLNCAESEAALNVARRMTFEIGRRAALTMIVKHHARKGRHDEALRIARLPDSSRHRSHLISTVARECAWRGDHEQGRTIAGGLGDDALRRSVATDAALEAAEAGRTDQSWEWLKLIEEPQKRDEARARVVTTWLESRKEVPGPDRLTGIQEMADAMRTPAYRADILFALAEAQLEAGRNAGAGRVAEDLLDLGNARYIREFDHRMANLMIRLGRDGEARRFFREAVEEARRIACGSCRRETLQSLQSDMVQAGLGDLAVKLLGSTVEPSLRFQALITLARRKLAGDEKEKVSDLTREALSVLPEIEATPECVKYLVQMADIYRRGRIKPGEREKRVIEQLVRTREKEEGVPENPSEHGKIRFLYFYTPACSECARVSDLLGEIRRSRGDVVIRKMNILNRRAAELNKGLCRVRDLPEEEHLTAPAVFASGGQLVDREITREALLRLAEASRGDDVPWRRNGSLQTAGEEALKEGYRKFTPMVVIAAGLADGFNPCAFAVIIFFVTYMAFVGRDAHEIALAGGIYTAAVFVTYLAIGIGLHTLLAHGLEIPVLARRVVYLVMAGLLAVAAILSVKDAFHCLRGSTDKVALKLPEKLKKKIRRLMTRRARRGLTVFGALSLGVLVGLLEFPCTGQTYVPIIFYLSSKTIPSLGWLLLYNICFILPLLVIFACVFFGVSSEKIKELFQRHMAKTKFAMAGVFALLVVVLVLTMP